MQDSKKLAEFCKLITQIKMYRDLEGWFFTPSVKDFNTDLMIEMIPDLIYEIQDNNDVLVKLPEHFNFDL